MYILVFLCSFLVPVFHAFIHVFPHSICSFQLSVHSIIDLFKQSFLPLMLVHVLVHAISLFP